MIRTLPLMVLAGCARPGAVGSRTITVANTGESGAVKYSIGNELIEVGPGGIVEIATHTAKQPTPPDTAATISTAFVELSTGTAQYISQAMASPIVYLIAGIVLFAAGAFIWLGRKRAVSAAAGVGWLSFVLRVAPAGMGPVLMGLGLFVSILPWFLEQYGWIIGLSAFAIAAMYLGKHAVNMAKGGKRGA